ncbi:MAG: hypothetical protein JWO53_1131, partial [Chlamydiia bacterium]|nr:hypothetical protein [Chlamydiia bacterium]
WKKIESPLLGKIEKTDETRVCSDGSYVKEYMKTDKELHFWIQDVQNESTIELAV